MAADSASASGSTINTDTTRGSTQTGGQRTENNQGRNTRNNTGHRGGSQGSTNQNVQNLRAAARSFKGDTETMNGHVFQCYEERSDPTQFTKTMDALHDYAKRDLKTTDLSRLFGTPVVKPTIQKPTKLNDDADEVDQMILREEIKQYVSRTKDLQSNLAAMHFVT